MGFIKNLRLVIVISRDVCRTALKERMLYGFLLLALLFILMANVPFIINDPKVFENQSPREAAVQIGFVSVNIFTILITAFVSTSTLQSYLAKERLILLLSKPIKRWQILQGIVLGLFEMIFMNWFLMTTGIWLVIVSQTKILPFFIWTGLSITVLMALLYVTLVVFFYVFIPNVMAGILTILVIIAGFGVSLAQDAFSATATPFLIREFFLLGLNLLPKINLLWGISMQELALFSLKIHRLPIIMHTLAVIVVLNFFSVCKFQRLRQS